MEKFGRAFRRGVEGSFMLATFYPCEARSIILTEDGGERSQVLLCTGGERCISSVTCELFTKAICLLSCTIAFVEDVDIIIATYLLDPELKEIGELGEGMVSH